MIFNSFQDERTSGDDNGEFQLCTHLFKLIGLVSLNAHTNNCTQREQLETCLRVEANLTWTLNLLKLNLIVLAALPWTIALITFSVAIYIYIRKQWAVLNNLNQDKQYWSRVFKSIAAFFKLLGNLFHAHQVIGMEHIPRAGPALICYFHGSSPFDVFYAHSKVYLATGRHMKLVGEKFLFLVPGLRTMLDVIDATPGTVADGVAQLAAGHILFVSPGGLRECLFSGREYNIMWANRAGFAKIAHAAKAPVIPAFTTNSREVIIQMPFFTKMFAHLYERTRLPLIPLFGIFPVKMITYIGEPIEFDPDRSVEQLRELARQRLDELIKANQRLPGSVLHGILERFQKPKFD